MSAAIVRRKSRVSILGCMRCVSSIWEYHLNYPESNWISSDRRLGILYQSANNKIYSQFRMFTSAFRRINWTEGKQQRHSNSHCTPPLIELAIVVRKDPCVRLQQAGYLVKISETTRLNRQLVPSDASRQRVWDTGSHALVSRIYSHNLVARISLISLYTAWQTF